MSEEIRVALGFLPPAPSAPTKVEHESSTTSITVEWNRVFSADGVVVSGYILFMDDGFDGDFVMVYDGSKDAFTTKATVVELQSGLSYRFKVQSKNINGNSADSATSTIYACLVPSRLPTPTKVKTTSSAITISWAEPQQNACAVTGFSIFRNTGNNDALSVTVDPADVEHRPSLRQYQVSGLTSVGSTYWFKVRAFNNAGFSDSYSVLAVVLADEPAQPLQAPVSDALVTNESRIKVEFGPQADDENGGSPILSYELQMDDGIGGNFTSLIGGSKDSLETTFTISTGITEGGIYRFRFRSRNVNGWSLFSDIRYIKAATIPQRPPAPLLLSSTDASLTLKLG